MGLPQPRDVVTIVFHIGYAKCATTFLQRRIFPQLTGVHYLGRHREGERLDFVLPLALKDDVDQSAIRRDLCAQADPQAVNVLSHEGLLRPHRTARTLDRLMEVAAGFDEVRFLLSIREQVSLITSRFNHDRNISFSRRPIENVLDFTGEAPTCRWPVCATEEKPWHRLLPASSPCTCRARQGKLITAVHYDLDALHGELLARVPADHIHYLVVERLKADMSGEVRRLAAFLGGEAPGADYLSSISNTRENTAGEKRLGPTALPEEMRHRIRAHFRASNRAFAARAGVDLSLWPEE